LPLWHQFCSVMNGLAENAGRRWCKFTGASRGTTFVNRPGELK
jgi:hypothetical protein